MADESPFELRLSHAADWSRCGAFVSMQRAPSAAVVESEQDHTVRDEGTAMHWYAQGIKAGMPDWPSYGVGGMAPNGVELTDEIIDGAMFYVDFLDRAGVDWIIEHQMSATRIHKACGGTPDAFGFRADTATIHVGDLKGGFIPVDVFPNWQLIGYLAAVLDNFPQWEQAARWVEFTIIQPRAFHRDGPIRTYRTKTVDIYVYFDELRSAAEWAMNGVEAIAGPQCDNCAARAGCNACHAAGARAREISMEVFDNVLTPAAVDYELVRIEEAQRMLDARLTGLRAHAVHMIRTGKSLPNWSMQAGTGRLQWLDEAAERSAIALGDMMGKDVRKPVKAITPTQAAKVIPVELLESYSRRQRGELKLVRFDGNTAAKAFSKLTKDIK